MAFQVSPGINISEIDLTTTVPALATTTGAIGGVFRWGPVGKFVLVDSENTLVARYGKPTSDNYETFFTAANFLSYGNALYVSRAATTSAATTVYKSSELRGDQYIVFAANTTTGITAGQKVHASPTIIPYGTTVASVNTSTLSASFNASSAVATSGFITISHSLVDGEPVLYTVAAGNTAVSPLTSGTTYYVRNSNTSGVFLAASYGGTVITLTTGTSQTGHTLARTGTTRVTLSANALNGSSTTVNTQSLTFFDAGLAFNAIANSSTVNPATTVVKNAEDFENKGPSNTIFAGTEFVARYPGELGNSLKVSMCDSAAQYSSTIDPRDLTGYTNTTNVPGPTTGFSIAVNSTTANVYIESNTVGATTTLALFSNTSSISNTTNFITSPNHPFANGDTVVYSNTSGIAVVLTNGTTYYTVSTNTSGFCLSTTSGGSNISFSSINSTATGFTFNLAGNPLSSKLTWDETYVAAGVIRDRLTVGDYIEVGNTLIGKQFLKIKALGAVANNIPNDPTIAYFPVTVETPYGLSTNYSSNTISRKWEYYNTIASAPGTSRYLSDRGLTTVDQVSAIVVDVGGKFSGTPGTILEVYEDLSRATDAIGEDGTTNFYKTVINDNSRYVWATNDRVGAATTTAAGLINSTSIVPYSDSFIGGYDGANSTDVSLAALASAYDLFADASSVDVSLILTGKARGGTNGEQLANYLIDNIAETRKDCVVFVSPDRADVIGATNVEGLQASNIVTFRQSVRNSSYAFIDSGYKYQYDKYNDVYRYIPLNGDIAGLTARSDNLRDPWFSPAGYNRGQIKNLVKLAYSPSKTDCDTLYKSDINPVITKPGQGTILFGDKTALGRPSAFDRINVRRLFITLEKTIATAANQMLFEFNDEFTRAQFLNLIEPFLRDIQGRRGITDFRVVCDETNNTAEVIDSNRFVGDIYIKPAKSINYIQLNFVAVRSGVEFNEVVGQF